jgi:hypothetical protein
MRGIFKKLELKQLSFGQRIGWYFSSLVYGACIAAIAAQSKVLSDTVDAVPYLVFLACWLIGVGLLRIYLQDKDPTSFRSIMGFRNDKS